MPGLACVHDRLDNLQPIEGQAALPPPQAADEYQARPIWNQFITLSSSEGAAVAPALSVSAQTSRDARTALDALTVSLEATKLPIEVANEAPRKASFVAPTPSQILENWHAANLLVHEMFDNLYYEARHTVGLIKPMLTRD